MKNIKFIARSEEVYNTEDPPVPAYKKIPQWFKDIPQESKDNPEKAFRFASTVKKCTPFVDSLTSGYMICVPQDIGIKKVDGELTTMWGVPREDGLVLGPDLPMSRYDGMPVPDVYSQLVWRMPTYARIETPPGYSVLITHPINRYELPFLTMSAIIDTDKIHLAIDLNMWINDNFEGIIERGTPVAQVIPFKRENWEHSVLKNYTVEQSQKEIFKIKSNLNRPYQRFFWSKKTYR